MDSHLKRLLKKYNLKIKYSSTHGNGYIIRTPNDYPNLLVVKENLLDEETEKVVLHELGHAEADDDTQKDYKANYTTRLICESGAKNFVVHEQIKKYVDLGNDVASANWLNLAKYIGTDNYYLVQEELLKYGVE
ncbi:ImmA/IrrE family metallo-endopeptidase [Lactobacillus helveticus]|uniref:ImmA/IrrE family metallo-endopeptidase n=1 Tax=Lactobacillus helveticus TaxID=1587 RepID=UPI0021824D17|nr:ImmA/IrrE family metallo-endopeptidase [Lactobacillus helveticus]MCT0196507.1 ImmA/IrrE family metallo-endopeptidase [Lactobacillus helveticus]